MKRTLHLVMVLFLLALGGQEAIAQRSSTASHTVMIQILPSATMETDGMLRFDFDEEADESGVRIQETTSPLALNASTEPIRVSVGLSNQLPDDIRLRLADASGMRTPLSTSSRQIWAGDSLGKTLDLTFEAEVGGDRLYIG